MDALGPWAETCPELERAPVLLLAALVKEFFRALPQPLLAAELYPAWLQVLSKYLPFKQTEPAEPITSLTPPIKINIFHRLFPVRIILIVAVVKPIKTNIFSLMR